MSVTPVVKECIEMIGKRMFGPLSTELIISTGAKLAEIKSGDDVVGKSDEARKRIMAEGFDDNLATIFTELMLITRLRQGQAEEIHNLIASIEDDRNFPDFEPDSKLIIVKDLEALEIIFENDDITLEDAQKQVAIDDCILNIANLMFGEASETLLAKSFDELDSDKDTSEIMKNINAIVTEEGFSPEAAAVFSLVGGLCVIEDRGHRAELVSDLKKTLRTVKIDPLVRLEIGNEIEAIGLVSDQPGLSRLEARNTILAAKAERN